MYRRIGSLNNESLDGIPQYTGIEYDYEVPDNVVVSSPGGLSTTHHHYTKGIYGEGSSEQDMYAGEGKRYPYAEKGGMYSSGYDSSEILNGFHSPDVMYTRNFAEARPVPLGDGTVARSSIFPPPPSPGRDAYTSVPMEVPDISIPPEPVIKTAKLKVNPIVFFFVLLIVYISFDLLTDAGRQVLSNAFNKGRPLTWKMMVFVGIAMALLFWFASYFFDIPILSLEMT